VNCVTFYQAAVMEARWRGRTVWSDWLSRHLAARIAEHRS